MLITHIDVCNGDADGLCALQQLRLAEPLAPERVRLVTGVKRHTRLLDDVPTPPAGTHVTVLDVAFGENRAGVERLLAAGARVRYFDHHLPGELPTHPALETHIDMAPDVCTSLLVDRHLGGTQRAWAVTGAFGDNLIAAARAAAEPLGLAPGALEALRELGELLNYNGYGESLADLHFHPADLFRALAPHADPQGFAARAPELEALRRGLAADLALVGQREPALDAPEGIVVLLPEAPWARRVQGTHANRLANANPQRATAVGVMLPGGALRLSLRAPPARPRGAEALARRFGGGGRSGAAGINALAPAELPAFLAAFQEAFGAA